MYHPLMRRVQPNLCPCQQPDSQTSRCDTFLCGKKFSMFERRHVRTPELNHAVGAPCSSFHLQHCRKCGGIFCSACSTRSTLLLDTSNLPFINPPRNVSITAFESSEAPVELARVCDECYDQIHGSACSRQLRMKQRASSLQWEADSNSTVSSTSSSPRTPPTPLDGSAIAPMPLPTRRPLHRSHTSPRVPTLPPPPAVSEELAAYPLCHASAICKATGGGRWEPKPVVQWVGARPPGFKAQYEIEMEAEEAEQRRLKSNPIIRDGDFQLRAPREFEPRSIGGPIKLSTF